MKNIKEALVWVGIVAFYGTVFGFGFFSVGWLMSGVKIMLLNY